MITFEIDNSKEGIEIFLDSNGVTELQRYLNYIKDHKDHYHLLSGNELDRKLYNNENTLVKHVKLIFIE